MQRPPYMWNIMIILCNFKSLIKLYGIIIEYIYNNRF